MEKGAKKFLALVSFAGLASSMGVTGGVYAANMSGQGLQQNSGSTTGGQTDPQQNSRSTTKGQTDPQQNSGSTTKGQTDPKDSGGTPKAEQSDAEARRLAEEAKKREENKAKGKVDDEYDVFYALDSGKNFAAAYSSYFDKVKIGDKDFYKKKGDLKEDMLLEADKALADFTPYYFGKNLTVNGFDKLTTAGIASGAAVVAAGTALAIREYMAGNSSNDGEDSE